MLRTFAATLVRKNTRTDLDALTEIIRQNDVDLVIAGNPLHMSGEASAGSARAAHFAEKLGRRAGVEVRLVDERLTSRQAGRVLRESGISIAKRAKAVDRLSAVLLLEGFLDHERAGETRS